MTTDMQPIHALLLLTIHEHRFADSHQLTRLTMHRYGNRRSAIRQTSRHLRELQRQNYLVRLERRIGGWQGGSGVSIWTLSTKGMRHLSGSGRRVRPHHHTTTFLRHHLAITETRVTLHEAAQQLHCDLEVQIEPNCWRPYVERRGEASILKPDLAATLTSNEYVDRYFIEVDRDTENPARVIAKCWRYLDYQRTGTEQREHGVYPAVIWLVPHEARKRQLTDAITSEPGLPRHLFTVITMTELLPLVKDVPPTVN